MLSIIFQRPRWLCSITATKCMHEAIIFVTHPSVGQPQQQEHRYTCENTFWIGDKIFFQHSGTGGEENHGAPPEGTRRVFSVGLRPPGGPYKKGLFFKEGIRPHFSGDSGSDPSNLLGVGHIFGLRDYFSFPLPTSMYEYPPFLPAFVGALLWKKEESSNVLPPLVCIRESGKIQTHMTKKSSPLYFAVWERINLHYSQG